MTALLRYANFRKVGDALGVTRQTVSRWARGDAITPYQERRLRELLDEETAAPEWERLEAKVDAIARSLGVSLLEVEAQARAGAALREHSALADDDDPPPAASSAPNGPAHSPAPRGR